MLENMIVVMNDQLHLRFCESHPDPYATLLGLLYGQYSSDVVEIQTVKRQALHRLLCAVRSVFVVTPFVVYINLTVRRVGTAQCDQCASLVAEYGWCVGWF